MTTTEQIELQTGAAVAETPRVTHPALRDRWIRQHSAFLSKALAAGDPAGSMSGVPAVPRRRVDEGGFTDMLRRPGVRQMVEKWWTRVLDLATLDG